MALRSRRSRSTARRGPRPRCPLVVMHRARGSDLQVNGSLEPAAGKSVVHEAPRSKASPATNGSSESEAAGTVGRRGAGRGCRRPHAFGRSGVPGGPFGAVLDGIRAAVAHRSASVGPE
jgi:hypothetical protein